MCATAFVSAVPLLHSGSKLSPNSSCFRLGTRFSRSGFSRSRSAAPLQPPRRPSQNVTPRMLSPITVVVDLLGLSAVGAGAFFLTKSPSAGKADSKEGSPGPGSPAATATPDSTPTSPAGVSDSMLPRTAVLGLTNASPQPPPPPPEGAPKPVPLIGGGPDESVGVDINDYMDMGVTVGIDGDEDDDQREERRRRERAERIQEELAWANAALLDLPSCEAVAILNASKRIVLADGALIADDTSQPGSLLLGVSSSRQSSVANVDGNADLPFLSPDVRCVTAVPVGAQGAALLLAARQRDAFSTRDMRVISAVCERLSPFLYVPPVIEV